MNYQQIIYLLLGVFLSGLLSAAELKVKPGLWETTMTRTNPMTGQPLTQTDQNCVKDSTFDPVSVMKDVEGCKVAEESLSGNTLSFVMSCNMHGVTSTISGQFQSEGDHGKGNMDLTMNAPGMNITTNMSWTTKRIGECQ